MSINVTVRGNPISIERGKMVTYDVDSDFKHRRRIRLQQVRDQSKEIADDIRNRVRKEKEKQLTKAEKKGEEDLKRWQVRKLLALQQQYQDCLREVGSAHTRAALEPDDNEILQEQAEQHQVEANIRHEIATNKLRREEKEKRIKMKKEVELRKKIRKSEDERAAMVTKVKRKLKKKRKKSKVVVSEPETDGSFISDRENIFPISDGENISPISAKDKNKICINISSPDNVSDSSITSKSTKTSTPSPKNSGKSRKTDSIKSRISKKSEKVTKVPEKITKVPEKITKVPEKITKVPEKITKVSDRIKQRKPIATPEKSKKTELQVDTYELIDIHSETDLQPLPYIPTTTLIPESIQSKKEKDKPIVQRIAKESIRVNPPSDRSESTDTEIKELAEIRNKVAMERGVRAMEKERMEKNYQQLLEELPLLQKQERLAQMKNHNPTYHMPENRLEELEQRKQNKIENIFEKYYHKSKILETPLVTILPIPKSLPGEELKLPFEILDLTDESSPQLNVAQWSTEDMPPGPCICEESPTEDKQAAILDLLQRINHQRELLLQEVSTLPSCSNLQKIIQEDELLKLCFPCPESLNTKISVATSPPPPSSEKTQKRRSVQTTSSDSSTKIEKKKKRKTRKKQKLITTNGTQTSPETIKQPGFICSCKLETTSDPCQCKNNKLSKTRTQSERNICCDCDQEYEIKPVDRHSKEKKYGRNIYKCLCGEIFQEDIHKKQKEDEKKLCEIIIKASSQADVKVHKEEEQCAGKRVILNVSKPFHINIKPREDASCSTTYMSLSDIGQRPTSEPKNLSQDKCQEYKDLLHAKPKQSNVGTSDTCPFQQTNPKEKRELTPTLLRYIQKLLSMSRQNIDELPVSSISDVSTPGPSVINVDENKGNPIVQIQNVMQHYNLSLSDIQKQLSDSGGRSPLNKNIECKCNEDPEPTDKVREVKSPKQISFSNERSCSEVTPCPETQKSRTSVAPKSPRNYEEAAEMVKDTFDLHSDDMKDIPFGNLVSRYKFLTQTCCERINELTNRIDKVRLEKERLLSPNMNNRSNGNKSQSSVSQEAMDEYLLAIEKVPSPKSMKKRGSSSKCKKKSPSGSPKKQTDSPTNLNNVVSPPRSPSSIKPQASAKCPCSKDSSVSIFQDTDEGILKYDNSPRTQTAKFASSSMKQFPPCNKTKPPPPVLLRNATKFNLDIGMTPHELSTIAEMDSVSELCMGRPDTSEEPVFTNQQESHIDQPRSPRTVPYLACAGECSRSGETDEPIKSSLKETCRSCSPTSPTSHTDLQNSESSTSSPEDMETVLRNMGLDWAITTLKKTKEALALSSSSNSTETNFRKRVSFQDSNNTSSSNSEIREAIRFARSLRNKENNDIS